MIPRVSTEPVSFRRFSPLCLAGLFLRTYVAFVCLLVSVAASVFCVPVLLWEGCTRLLRGKGRKDVDLTKSATCNEP